MANNVVIGCRLGKAGCRRQVRDEVHGDPALEFDIVETLGSELRMDPPFASKLEATRRWHVELYRLVQAETFSASVTASGDRASFDEVNGLTRRAALQPGGAALLDVRDDRLAINVLGFPEMRRPILEKPRFYRFFLEDEIGKLKAVDGKCCGCHMELYQEAQEPCEPQCELTEQGEGHVLRDEL